MAVILTEHFSSVATGVAASTSNTAFDTTSGTMLGVAGPLGQAVSDPASGAAGYLQETISGGTPASIYINFLFVTNQPLVSANSLFMSVRSTTGPNAQVRQNTDGTLTIINNTAAALKGSYVLVSGTTYVLRWTVNASGTQTLVIVDWATGTVRETLSGACVAAALSVFRLGPAAAGPTNRSLIFDEVTIDNASMPADPSHTPPPPNPTWSYWDGTTEQTLTLSGVWNGSSVDPVAYDNMV